VERSAAASALALPAPRATCAAPAARPAPPPRPTPHPPCPLAPLPPCPLAPLQHVDIFDREFLFIPVHDALHWSLVVICHPGRAPPQQLPKQGKGKGAAAPRRQQQGQDGEEGKAGEEDSHGGEGQQQGGALVVDLVGAEPGGRQPGPAAGPAAGAAAAVATPCILHLDSLGGGHNTAETVKPLYSYLEREWRRKVGPGAVARCSWAAARLAGGCATSACACLGLGAAAGWLQARRCAGEVWARLGCSAMLAWGAPGPGPGPGVHTPVLAADNAALACTSSLSHCGSVRWLAAALAR
jgi:hypothetical protein